MFYDEMHIVLTQGNSVSTVSEGTYVGAHIIYYDFLFVENSKFAERWYVMESIADYSAWQNGNGISHK
jgi:hypothetical protein